MAWAVGAATPPPQTKIHGSSTAAHAPFAPILDAEALAALRPRLRAGCPVAFDAYRLHLLATQTQEAALTSPPPAPLTPTHCEAPSVAAILRRETLASDALFTPLRHDDARRVIDTLDAGSPLSTLRSVARAAELTEVGELRLGWSGAGVNGLGWYAVGVGQGGVGMGMGWSETGWDEMGMSWDGME